MSPENKHCFHFADVLLSCCVLLYEHGLPLDPHVPARRC
jgi:hypothetical protein